MGKANNKKPRKPQKPRTRVKVNKEWQLDRTLLDQMNEAAASAESNSSAAAPGASASASAAAAPVLRRILHSLQVGSKDVVGDCATYARLLRFFHLRVVCNSSTREIRVVAADLLNAFEMRNPGYEWNKK